MLMSPHAAEVAQVTVEEKVAAVTTGAGNPEKYMTAWKAAGVKVIPVVASVALARRMERCGADAVIAEGMESGGHIGESDDHDAGAPGGGRRQHPGHCRRRHRRRKRFCGSYDAGGRRQYRWAPGL